MSTTFHRIAVVTTLAGVAALVSGALLYVAGARINTSRSIPLGLYWTVHAPVESGAYVMFCPPELGVFDEAKRRGYIAGGFCPGGYGYLMKKILAAKDDVVAVSQDGVRVNGHLLLFSVPLAADSLGRPLPRFQDNTYTLSEYQLLLMSDVNPRSFDGRYFGPIQRSQVRSVIVPILTW